MAAGIRQALEEMILAPVGGYAGVVHLGQLGVVTAQHIDVFPIRAQYQRMRPMLTATGQRHNGFLLVILAITVGVGKPVHAGATPVHVHPQAAKRMQKALCGGDVDLKLLHFRFFTAHINAIKPLATLVAGNQPTFIIHTQANPRALFALGNSVK